MYKSWVLPEKKKKKEYSDIITISSISILSRFQVSDMVSGYLNPDVCKYLLQNVCIVNT